MNTHPFDLDTNPTCTSCLAIVASYNARISADAPISHGRCSECLSIKPLYEYSVYTLCKGCRTYYQEHDRSN